MQESFEPLVIGCPVAWAEHPAAQPALRAEPEYTRAEMAAINEACRQRRELRLREQLFRRWRADFWARKRAD
jgi:hypothetical protein